MFILLASVLFWQQAMDKMTEVLKASITLICVYEPIIQWIDETISGVPGHSHMSLNDRDTLFEKYH